MLEPAVDRLGRPVGLAGALEAGEHVVGTLLQGPPEDGELGEHVATPWMTDSMRLVIRSQPLVRPGSR